MTSYQVDIRDFGEFNFNTGSITSVLKLTGVSYPEHEGKYMCTCQNSHGGVQSSAYSNITVHVLGKFPTYYCSGSDYIQLLIC